MWRKICLKPVVIMTNEGFDLLEDDIKMKGGTLKCDWLHKFLLIDGTYSKNVKLS